MKLTIVGLNYSPEPTGIAVYTAGLAEGLADRGSQIYAIVGYPHYPQWKVYPGYEGRSRTDREKGVTVHRVRQFVPAEPRLANRMLMEVDFGLKSLLARWRRPDALLFVSPALFSVALGMLKAKLTRTPASIWVQDIYSLGVSESGTGGRFAGKVLRLIERAVLRSADSVVVIHERFKRYLVEDLGLEAGRVEVVRNWSHLDTTPHSSRSDVRAAHGWADDDIIVLHAGNMGAKQGLENVVEASRVASSSGSRVRFVLLGDGNQRPMLEAMGSNAKLDILDPVAENEFMATLLAADVLLVNERPGLTEMSVPSKLTSYFSSGLPVIAATDSSSVTAQELELSGGGLRVDADSPGALVAAAERLAADPELARDLGSAGRLFSERLLTPGPAIETFERIVSRMCAPSVTGVDHAATETARNSTGIGAG
ncbi:glycosyltransferase family 4 protein [Lacisediminihabitans sp.]|jgi:glycosyltransferase involved in cell wall biosynthesis|uniref:glycosyltransferase family 4 protein n=1 Tax=Lacisediminihabitans sp. TaxID=2787631 RepID=UPI002F933EFB